MFLKVSRSEEADHIDVLRHQLREKEQTIEKLKDQLNSAGDVIRKQTEQIEILKSANTSVAMEKENTEKELRKRLKDYEKQLMICKSEHVDKCLIVDHMRRLLNGVLTNNQLDVILGRKKKPHWTTEEIALAFAIRYLSKRCYLFLREEIHFPLPCISTLSSYAQKIDMRNGVLKDVLKSMHYMGLELSERDRACVISYDEMSVCKTLEYDRSNDEIVGPHTHAQIVMVRGLFSKWKQVIFVDFDQPMTVNILLNIIEELHHVNFNVVAINSDNAPENTKLRKQLGKIELFGYIVNFLHFDIYVRRAVNS